MHQFDQDVLVNYIKTGEYSRTISENWSINGVPNGGYLMAIIADAMLQKSQMKTTPILTANFLNRCEPGEAIIIVDEMSTSRQFARLHACLQLFYPAKE